MTERRPHVERARLERAAARLRPIERQVLLLSAGKHLSLARVADRLGITPAAAKRILARALVRLDQAIEQEQRQRWWPW